jgi:hypothetical protein
MKWWFKLSMVLLAVIILYISLTRAGLELVNRDEKSDNLRNVPILYLEKDKNGELKEYSYKLPETKTLPDNPFYFIKKLRDELWIKFTNNPLDKARITLLIADKRIEDARKLNQKQSNKNIINKTIEEADQKLELAEQLLLKLDQDNIEVNKIEAKINEAKKAYKTIKDQM